MLEYKKNIPFHKLEQELQKLSGNIESLSAPRGFLQAMLYIISELVVNIQEHSRAKKAEILVRIGKKDVTIEIADSGIGLRESYLRNKIYPKDDFSAIEFAVSGLSTKGGQERGFGLYSIKKLAEALRGTLVITTGRAEAIFERGKVSFRTVSRAHKGTLVDLTTLVKDINLYKIL